MPIIHTTFKPYRRYFCSSTPITALSAVFIALLACSLLMAPVAFADEAPASSSIADESDNVVAPVDNTLASDGDAQDETPPDPLANSETIPVASGETLPSAADADAAVSSEPEAAVQPGDSSDGYNAPDNPAGFADEPDAIGTEATAEATGDAEDPESASASYEATQSQEEATENASSVAVTSAAPATSASPVLMPKAAPKAKISSVKAKNVIYTGKAITPTLVVKSGAKTLVKDTDYRLVLSNNKKVGKALVTVTGIGKYAGTLSTTFRIYAKPKYSGATLMPVLSKAVWVVKNAKIKLVSGKTVVKLKGKTVTALKKGSAKIAVYNKLGKKVATKTVKVFNFTGGILLRPSSSKKLYLDIADSSDKAGASAQLTARNAKADQHFLITLAKGNGYIIQATNSGLVLQAKNASKKNNASIVQAAPNRKASQRWTITVDGDNKLTFVNKASGKALTLKGSAKSGATAVQRTNKNAKAQKWTLVVQKVSYSGATVLPVSSTGAWKVKNGTLKITAGKDVVSFKDGIMKAKSKGSATITITDAIGTKVLTQNISVYALSGDYYINSAVDVGMVLDIDHASADDGGNAILWWSNGQDNQKWSFKLQDDGSYLIKSASSGKVLQVADSSLKNGANIEQWKSTGADNQKWNITVDAANILTFVNKASGKALALEGGSTVKGTNISQTTVKSTQGAQKFGLISLKQLQKTNSKFSALAVAACKYAYSVPVRYQNKSANTGTALYKRLCNTLYPGLEQLSCDRGVACAVKWSGADVSFPGSAINQYPYMMKSSNWQYLGRWSGNIADLQPGDILIRTKKMQDKDKKTTTNHVCMYVSNAIATSVYKTYIKGTDGDRGAPASDAAFVGASRQRNNRANAAAACIGNKSYAIADQRMAVFRCTNTSFSTKYSYLI